MNNFPRKTNSVKCDDAHVMVEAELLMAMMDRSVALLSKM